MPSCNERQRSDQIAETSEEVDLFLEYGYSVNWPRVCFVRLLVHLHTVLRSELQRKQQNSSALQRQYLLLHDLPLLSQ